MQKSAEVCRSPITDAEVSARTEPNFKNKKTI